MNTKVNKPKESRLHARNRNREQYDLKGLVSACPELRDFISKNIHGNDSIDFSNPMAVKSLNKALLKYYYGIKYWDFPKENLCPPVPGRADYLHYMADLLGESNKGVIPKGNKITCLDVGVGANCIYPIVGVVEYGWKFIGSDIEPESIKAALNIVNSNPALSGKIDCKLQSNSNNVFYGVLSKDEKIDLSICNPPFHSTVDDARKGNQQKVKNLSGKKTPQTVLNFSGKSKELVCEGGEYRFITNMVRESKKFAKNCFWFSSLVSKQSNVRGIRKAFDKYGVTKSVVIPVGTGNKISRIVAWTFLTEEEQLFWRNERWK